MVEGRIRLGFVSAAHLHTRGLLRSALECAEAEVVGLAEPDDELRELFAREFSGLSVYRTADELFDSARPQAIVTCADNRSAANVVADAASRGVHVMKEKPMAADLLLADRMATAAVRGGIRLMVNWPPNWQPATHHAKTLIDSGEIGQVWQVHHRAGHGGPPADYARRDPVSRVGWGWLIERETNGGGALIDFCSYGAAFSRWFMGQPSRVVAMGGRYAKDFFSVEDNAIIVLGYPRGHSVCEATWTQPATPVRTPLMIYGTAGAIAVTGAAEIALAARAPGGGAAEPQAITAPALPEHFRSGPAYFVHQLLTEEPFAGLVSGDVSRDAQEILQAGVQSLASGTEVGLPLRAYLEG
ncbi:MAG TPA: Gfo/Idh/MocA family oxidoreductase [Chloroflexota bacterium]|jgi:predicted dehydrogenase|nr:Gfo/Idh/MocA family oxidoreductase [Chloroflexota bacterium]